jgi:uncharacterized protein YciI
VTRYFAAVVQRTSLWDHSRPAHEQDGFAQHAKYMGSLEAEGFIVLAGLLTQSTDVLFIFRAESEEQVRNRLSQDPWQQDGHARLIRLEEIAFRNDPPLLQAASPAPKNG